MINLKRAKILDTFESRRSGLDSKHSNPKKTKLTFKNYLLSFMCVIHDVCV